MEFALVALIMVLGLGAYWAMVIAPKQRDFTRRQRMVRNLETGVEVVTYGGIIGRVIELDSNAGIVHLEISEGLTVRVLAAAIIQTYDPVAIARSAQAGDDLPAIPAERIDR